MVMLLDWRAQLVSARRLATGRLAPDSIRRVANEAVEQWSDDSKVAPGLVNDWSISDPALRRWAGDAFGAAIGPAPPPPHYRLEPPIRVELMTYGLRNRCSTN